jgi:hypothetical protein
MKAEVSSNVDSSKILRGYVPVNQQHVVNLPGINDQSIRAVSRNTQDDERLDPVSALLQASEIVSRGNPRG